MADVVVTGSTSTTISLAIVNLQENLSEYTNFRFQLRVGGAYVYSSSPSVTVYNLTPDTTYTILGQAEIGGQWYSATSTYGVTRPSNFSWTYPKVQNQEINITAYEWAEFTTRINRFRYWKGLTPYSFSGVSVNTEIYASVVNEAVYAMSAMTSNTPFIVNTGDLITAYFFNSLVSSLNSIN